jgi:hypothetical protein
MCTLSVISLPRGVTPAQGGFRVVVNRDEQHDRPPALYPRWRRVPTPLGRTRAIWTIDPRGGGTWIGATEHGLVLALLNLNLRPAPALPDDLRSRGSVIPSLIGLGRGDAVMDALHAMDLSLYAPFRLVAIEPDARAGCVMREAAWDRSGLRIREGIVPPACFVSSGLGDDLVACRLDLFDEFVRPAPTPDAQDRFHAHAWLGREHLSVRMHRADARTVSVTRVEVLGIESGLPRVRVGYRPVGPAGEPMPRIDAALGARAGAAAAVGVGA